MARSQSWKYKLQKLLDNAPLILVSICGAAWTLVILAALTGWIR